MSIERNMFDSTFLDLDNEFHDMLEAVKNFTLIYILYYYVI